MTEKSRYGNLYWCILVPKSIATDGVIYLMADKITIEPDGTLVAHRIGTKAKSGFINLALASGNWIGVYAASVIDGDAVAVESWRRKIR